VRLDAAEVLGKIGDLRAVEPLIAALSDEDLGVRQCATDALGKIGDPRAVEPLINSALLDESLSVRERAARALGKIGEPTVESSIVALSDTDWDVRLDAAEVLGKIGDPRAIPALEKAINDSHENVRDKAKEALAKIKPSDGAKSILT
jgi:HEAT repeat protein